jgi:hypothetical protein
MLVINWLGPLLDEALGSPERVYPCWMICSAIGDDCAFAYDGIHVVALISPRHLPKIFSRAIVSLSLVDIEKDAKQQRSSTVLQGVPAPVVLFLMAPL